MSDIRRMNRSKGDLVADVLRLVAGLNFIPSPGGAVVVKTHRKLRSRLQPDLVGGTQSAALMSIRMRVDYLVPKHRNTPPLPDNIRY